MTSGCCLRHQQLCFYPTPKGKPRSKIPETSKPQYPALASASARRIGRYSKAKPGSILCGRRYIHFSRKLISCCPFPLWHPAMQVNCHCSPNTVLLQHTSSRRCIQWMHSGSAPRRRIQWILLSIHPAVIISANCLALQYWGGGREHQVYEIRSRNRR